MTLIIILLAAFNFAHVMDFMIIMPLNPFLTEGLNISVAQFNYLVSIYTASAGISSLIVATFIDQLDRKYALLSVTAGFILATFGCAFSQTYHQLFLFRILSGAFGGVTGTLVLSVIGDIIPLERRSSAMSMVMMAFALSSVIGMPFGLYLADTFGWSTPFLAIAIIALLIFVVAIFKLPNVRGHLKDGSKPLKPIEVFRNALTLKNQRNALVLMFLLILGQFTLIPNISGYMVSNVGLEKDQLFMIYLAGGLATFVTMPFIGKLADRFDRSRVFVIFALLSIVPIIWITNMPKYTIIQVLMVTVPFFIFISGRMIPATTIMTSVVKSSQRAGYMSVNTAVREFSASFSALVASWFIFDSDGIIYGFENAGYIAVISTILAVVFIKKVKAIKE